MFKNMLLGVEFTVAAATLFALHLEESGRKRLVQP